MAQYGRTLQVKGFHHIMFTVHGTNKQRHNMSIIHVTLQEAHVFRFIKLLDKVTYKPIFALI
jgi:hypothetical protein